MSVSSFEHVRIAGVKTTLPQRFIDIDDELEFFDGAPKKLARAKKMMGYGRRYLCDDDTTVTDLAVDAARKLMAEMKIEPESIELLIFVNQDTDYLQPTDACIAHGELGLNSSCAALHINQGCPGYVQGLWTAHALIACGAVHNCLLLAGDAHTKSTDQRNRKRAPIFGDSASATFLQDTEEPRRATFIMGTDGTGWDKVIVPFGGMRLPFDAATLGLTVKDDAGNIWTSNQGLMKGEDVFRFTMDRAPALIRQTMEAAGWKDEDVDLFAIHQANGQIVRSIIEKAGIPAEKTPSDVFSKYANHSTNSVVTVLCDQSKNTALKNVVFCSYGVGLAWGGAAVNLSGIYNGGFSTYVPPAGRMNREQWIQHWIDYIKEGGQQ